MPIIATQGSDIFRLRAWGEVAGAIAKNLHGKGAIKSPEVGENASGILDGSQQG
jgi:hypothetical protein